MGKIKLTITGASGMIGQNLATRDFLNNFDVTLHSRRDDFNSHSGFNRIAGNLNDDSVCEKIACNSDVIVHLAQTGSPITSIGSYKEYIENNMLPTLNLIDFVKKNNCETHFIFASSAGAIYKSSDSDSYTEVSSVNPLTPYGITKYTIENMLHSMALCSNTKVTVLRISNPFGSLLDPERLQGLIGVIFARIKSDLPIKIFGDINNIRDYIYIDDLIDIMGKIIDYKPKEKFSIYNIGSGEGYSVKEILSKIEQIRKKPLSIEYEKISGDNLLPSRIVLNISKVMKEFNWKPVVSLEKGMIKMAEKFGIL